jgi:hypothetical protein
MKFSMTNVKLIQSIWISIVIFLQVYVLTNEEEKGYMCRVLYVSWKFNACDEIGVFGRHMEKLGEEHANEC